MPLQYQLLEDRGILSLTGEDTSAFLQGLITQDMQKLSAERSLYGALLSPQGKYLFEFIMMVRGDSVLLDTEKARVEDFIKRLSLYKLRSKVTIAPENPSVFALWGENVHQVAGLPSEHGATLVRGNVILVSDPRHAELGVRCIGTIPDCEAYLKNISAAQSNGYEQLRLTVGIPEGSKDFIIDRSLPMEYGFEPLHGVDFNKGCYVGQEVMARSKHRATLRKSLFRVEADQALPAAGTPIMAGEKEVGELRSSLHNIGLALLRHEDIKEVQVLLAQDIPLRISKPEWLRDPH